MSGLLYSLSKTLNLCFAGVIILFLSGNLAVSLLYSHLVLHFCTVSLFLILICYLTLLCSRDFSTSLD